MPLGRSSSRARNKSRSPAPPSGFQSPVSSSSPYFPPSHYAAAAGISYRDSPEPAEKTGDYAGTTAHLSRSDTRYSQFSTPDQNQNTHSFVPIAYPSGSELGSEGSMFEFVQAPNSRSQQSHSHSKRNLGELEAQLLPSLRDTINRMTRPPSQASPQPQQQSSLAPSSPSFDRASSYENRFESSSMSSATFNNGGGSSSLVPRPSMNAHSISAPGPSHYTSPQIPQASEYRSATTTPSEPSTPKSKSKTKPKPILKSALRPPTPKLSGTAASSSPTPAKTLRGARSVAVLGTARNTPTPGPSSTDNKRSDKENTKTSRTENSNTTKRPPRARSRTDPGTSLTQHSVASSIPLTTTVTPQSKPPSTFTSGLPRRKRPDDDSEFEYQHEADRRRLIVTNAIVVPSSSESECEPEEARTPHHHHHLSRLPTFKPGVYQSSPGVYQSEPGVYQSEPGVYQSSPGVYQSSPGVYQSSPGVHQSSPTPARMDGHGRMFPVGLGIGSPTGKRGGGGGKHSQHGGDVAVHSMVYNNNETDDESGLDQREVFYSHAVSRHREKPERDSQRKRREELLGIMDGLAGFESRADEGRPDSYYDGVEGVAISGSAGEDAFGNDIGDEMAALRDTRFDRAQHEHEERRDLRARAADPHIHRLRTPTVVVSDEDDYRVERKRDQVSHLPRRSGVSTLPSSPNPTFRQESRNRGFVESPASAFSPSKQAYDTPVRSSSRQGTGKGNEPSSSSSRKSPSRSPIIRQDTTPETSIPKRRSFYHEISDPGPSQVPAGDESSRPLRKKSREDLSMAKQHHDDAFSADVPMSAVQRAKEIARRFQEQAHPDHDSQADGNQRQPNATSSSSRRRSRSHSDLKRADSLGNYASDALSLAESSYAAAARERKAFGIPPSGSDPAVDAFDGHTYGDEGTGMLRHFDSDNSVVEGAWQEDYNELSVGAETLFRQVSTGEEHRRPLSQDRRRGQQAPRYDDDARRRSRSRSPSAASARMSAASVYDEPDMPTPRPLSLDPTEIRSWRSSLLASEYHALYERYGEQEMCRQEVIWNLTETEDDFVNRLHGIVRLFITPLRVQQSNAWIAGVPTEVARLFDWLEDILNLHSQMLSMLQTARTEQHPIVELLAESIRVFIPRLEVYQPYLVRLEEVADMIRQLMTGETAVSDFGEFVKIQQNGADCGGWTLERLLIEPVNRLAAYSNCYRRLLDATPKAHPDYLPTFSLYHSTVMVIRVMGEVKVREDEYDLIKSISGRIHGLPPSVQLARRERRLLAEGLLYHLEGDRNCANSNETTRNRTPLGVSQHSSSRTPVHVFVFTDILVFAIPMKRRKHSRADDQRWRLLDSIGIARVLGVTEDSQNSPGFGHVFNLDVLPVDPHEMETGVISANSSLVSLCFTTEPPQDRSSSAPQTAPESWLPAFKQCFQFTLRSLSFPSHSGRYLVHGPHVDLELDTRQAVMSILASGLPLPKSPSIQIGEMTAGESEDAREQEREERGWWSLRFQQVLREMQRQDLPTAFVDEHGHVRGDRKDANHLSPWANTTHLKPSVS